MKLGLNNHKAFRLSDGKRPENRGIQQTEHSRCSPDTQGHRHDRDRIYELSPGGMVRAMAEGRLVALTRFEAGELVPVRVMNH